MGKVKNMMTDGNGEIQHMITDDDGELRYMNEVEREQWEIEHDPDFDKSMKEKQEENSALELYYTLEDEDKM